MSDQMSAGIKFYQVKYGYYAPLVVFDTAFYDLFVVPNKEDAIKKLEEIAGVGATLCQTKCVAKALKMKTPYCVPVEFYQCGHSKPEKDMDCLKAVADAKSVYGNTIVATGNRQFYKQLGETTSLPVIHYDYDELILMGERATSVDPNKGDFFVMASWEAKQREKRHRQMEALKAHGKKKFKRFKSRRKKREMEKNMKKLLESNIESVGSGIASEVKIQGNGEGVGMGKKRKVARKEKKLLLSDKGLSTAAKEPAESMFAAKEPAKHRRGSNASEGLVQGNGERVGMAKKGTMAQKEEKLLLSDNGLSTAAKEPAESMFAAKEPARHRRGNNASEGLVQGNGERVKMAKKGTMAHKEEKLLLSDNGLSTAAKEPAESMFAAKEPAKHRRGSNASEGLVQGNGERVGMAKKGTMAQKEEKLLLSDNGLSTAAKEPAESMLAAKEPAKHKRGKCKYVIHD